MNLHAFGDLGLRLKHSTPRRRLARSRFRELMEGYAGSSTGGGGRSARAAASAPGVHRAATVRHGSLGPFRAARRSTAATVGGKIAVRGREKKSARHRAGGAATPLDTCTTRDPSSAPETQCVAECETRPPGGRTFRSRFDTTSERRLPSASRTVMVGHSRPQCALLGVKSSGTPA